MASNRGDCKKAMRRLNIAMVAVCLICAPSLARAANNCKWINEATSGGLLGGDAVGEVTPVVPGQPTVCTFTQMTDGGKRTLRVSVEIATDPHARLAAIEQSCGADATSLKAIGNEALICAADDRKTGMGERVVGRIRNQVFTITMTTTLKNDPILTRDILKSKIYTAAEQVSGNLF
jgi:hypothetical protein